MAKGKHEAPSASHPRSQTRSCSRIRRSSGRKTIVPLIAALVLLVGVAAGGTMAYLTDNAQVTGTYEAGVVSYKIENDCVVNDGNVEVYVRATLVQSFTNADGEVCPNHPVLQTAADDDWVSLNPCTLVYSKPLAPGQASSPIPRGSMLTAGTVSEDDGCVAVLNVTVSAIQAYPASAVTEAWGFVPGV